MLSSVLFAGLLSVASAAPSAFPRSAVDPSKKYPPKEGWYPSNITTPQGAYYDEQHAKATKAAHKFKAQGGPVYGPGSFVDNPDGLTWYNSDFGAGTGGVNPSTTYTCYDGSVGGFPGIDQWMNFNALWTLNQQAGLAYTGDTPEQQQQIYNAIVQVSGESKVDARLILAVIMQESTGNVNVPCTAGYNCGLMQANHGSVSYDPNDSQNSITHMVTDGTEGTTEGPGYVQYMNGGPDYAYTNCPLANPYGAARAYNTGSCSTGGNLHCSQYGTPSYVNDVANRLVGWDGSGQPQGNCGFPAVGCT